MALQGYEIALIVLVIILLFGGAAAIPKLARAFGRAKGEFQKAKDEMEHEMKAVAAEAKDLPPTPPPTEEDVRRAAREMGILEAGMPLDQVKAEMSRRL